MRRDVLHIAHVLVAAFDLEALHARVDEIPEVVALVVVFHGQEMLVVGNHAAIEVCERKGQAAGLRAVAAIGAAAGFGVADIALT